MGYKVKVMSRTGDKVRYYGTGLFGKGKAYKTKQGAEKRAKELARLFKRPTEVVRSNN